jgi:hypothetical protein
LFTFCFYLFIHKSIYNLSTFELFNNCLTIFILVINMETTVAKLGGTNINCETPEGAAFVKKYTHPPSTIPDNYRGTPDASAPNVVCMEVKGENQVAPIITYPATTTTTTTVNPSTMLLLHPSGGKVATYNFMQVAIGGSVGYMQPISYAAFSSGGTVYPAVSNTTLPAANNSGYNWYNFISDIATMRTSYKSETVYLNATDFNNQGQITTAKFKPNILAVNSATTLFDSHANDRHALKSLYTALGLKVPLPKIKDEDGYEVIRQNVNVAATLFGFGIQVLQVGTTTNAAAVTSVLSSPSLMLSGILPMNSSGVLTYSSKGTTRMLKEGAFVVHQNIGPISEWTAVATEGIPLSATFSPNGVYVSLIRANYSSTYVYAPLYSDSTAITDTMAGWYNSAFDTPWNNLDWAMTICEGITIPSTVGVTLSSVPYLSIKSFAGFEAQPNVGSSLLPFQSMLPKPDPTALKMAAGIFHERPDSLPASANDLGTIAATIGSFLPTAIGWLKNIFGSKPETKQPPQKEHKVRQRPREIPAKKSNFNVALESKIDKLARAMSNMKLNAGNSGYSLSNATRESAKPRRNAKRPNNTRTFVNPKYR